MGDSELYYLGEPVSNTCAVGQALLVVSRAYLFNGVRGCSVARNDKRKQIVLCIRRRYGRDMCSGCATMLLFLSGFNSCPYALGSTFALAESINGSVIAELLRVGFRGIPCLAFLVHSRLSFCQNPDCSRASN